MSILTRSYGTQRVFLLRFADRGAQTAALGRLSLFLEDAGTRGTVVAALPTGQSAGVAAYSGHNFRSGDAASFFNAVRCVSVNLALGAIVRCRH